MLKRVGILAFVLTAGALFQPAAVFAADWSHGNAMNEHRETARVETARMAASRDRHSEAVRRDDRAFRRDDRANDRSFRGDDRMRVETAPVYHSTRAHARAYGR